MEKIDIDEIALKLNYLKETKNQIKAALVEKGIEVKDTDTFRSYANKIENINFQLPPTASICFRSSRAFNPYEEGSYSEAFVRSQDVANTLNKIGTENIINFSNMFDDSYPDETIFKYNATHFEWVYNRDSSFPIPEIDMSSGICAMQMFKNYDSDVLPTFKNTNHILDFTEMFANSSIVDAPEIDTSGAVSMKNMFKECYSLENVPIYDFSNIRYSGAYYNMNIAFMFTDCPNLTNESLNNIIASCIGATYINENLPSEPSYKPRLAQLGLSDEQITTCKGLSNYQELMDIGWRE